MNMIVEGIERISWLILFIYWRIVLEIFFKNFFKRKGLELVIIMKSRINIGILLLMVMNVLYSSDFNISFNFFEVFDNIIWDGFLFVYEFRNEFCKLFFVVSEFFLFYEILMYYEFDLVGVFLEEVFLLFMKGFIFGDILNGLLELEGSVC